MKPLNIILIIAGILLLFASIIFCSLYSVANRGSTSFEYYFNTIVITLLLIFFGMFSIFGAVKNGFRLKES